MSGYTIYNNTFKAVQTGIMIGGGRRNHVKWNHFEDCDTAIEFDNRGKDYTGKAVSATTDALPATLSTVFVTRTPSRRMVGCAPL